MPAPTEGGANGAGETRDFDQTVRVTGRRVGDNLSGKGCRPYVTMARARA